MMANDLNKLENYLSNKESLYSFEKVQKTEQTDSLQPISVQMLEKLKDSTKKLICLMEEIQMNTIDSKCMHLKNSEHIITPSTSVEVNTTEIQDLTKFEKHTQNIENFLNREDNDCSVYKKLTRKCTCLNNKQYNDFTIHFNEDTKHFTSRIGEIIKNLRIVKKFLYMGNVYTLHALKFLNEGIHNGSFTEKVEIIQGCAHADMCDVFEERSIILFCIQLTKIQEDMEIPLQTLITELINEMARIEEGRRYLTFNAKITNEIRKVLRKERSKLEPCLVDKLESTLNLLLPSLKNCSNLYYSNPLNEGLLNKVLCALDQQALLTEDELFFYLTLLKNISCFENGKAEIKLNLCKVFNLIKCVLMKHDNSEMNIIVTSILDNIMSGKEDENALVSVANVETEHQDNTFKNYYFQDSSDQELTLDSYAIDVKNKSLKRSSKNNIDDFFEKPKRNKKVTTRSSSVSTSRDNGVSYITSNENESGATHLIKIEVYELNKINHIAPINYWKYADVRVKYYVQSECDKNYQSTRDVIYNITKQLASKCDCSKYFIESKEEQK